MEKYIVDGLLVLIFAATVIHFGKQGFAKSVLSAVVSIGAIIVAWMFGKTVGAWLNEVFVSNAIVEMVRSALDKVRDYAVNNMSAEEILAVFPEQLRQILGYVNLDPEGLIQNVMSGVDLTEFAQEIGGTVAKAVSNGLGMVITYFAAFVALKLAATLVDGIFHLPVLNSLNGAMGAVLGMAIGFCICFIFANLFHAVMVVLSANNPELSAFIMPEGTVLYSFFLYLIN